jgi:hypothetical protein
MALKENNDKIMRLEERYMNNEVETSTYKTWFKKLTEEKSELELAMKPKFRQNDYAEKSIGRTLPHLKNLFRIFDLVIYIRSMQSSAPCSKTISLTGVVCLEQTSLTPPS